MSKPTPQWPVKADHRFMLKIADLILGGKIVPLPGEFDRVARVFSKAGGSWKSLFQGSVEDVELLKTVFKMAFKHGYLTKKEKWA